MQEENSGLLFSPQPAASGEIESGLFKVAQLEQRARQAKARGAEEESSGLVDINEIIDPTAVPKGASSVTSFSPLVEATQQAPEAPPATAHGDSRTLLIVITALLMLLGLLAFLALR